MATVPADVTVVCAANCGVTELIVFEVCRSIVAVMLVASIMPGATLTSINPSL